MLRRLVAIRVRSSWAGAVPGLFSDSDFGGMESAHDHCMISRKLAILSAASMFAASCGGGRSHAASQPVPNGREVLDTTLFAAVARVEADSAKLPFEIDPRPLEADEIDVPDPGTWAAVAESIVEQRRASLRALGISPGAAEIPDSCPSILSPSDSTRSRRNCPAAARMIVAVGLPRAHSEFAPGGLTHYAAVRVPELIIGPEGWLVVSYECIMEPSPGGWRLRLRRAVMNTE